MTRTIQNLLMLLLRLLIPPKVGEWSFVTVCDNSIIQLSNLSVVVVVCSLISFVEFQAFESILCAPDAISLLSFKLFDVYKSGKVSYGKN